MWYFEAGTVTKKQVMRGTVCCISSHTTDHYPVDEVNPGKGLVEKKA
jgi:hypothetical protein